MNALPLSLSIDNQSRRVRLDPHDDVFVQDPWPAYDAIRAASPVFFWEEYGLWCCAGYEDVNRLLRDRRLGRENRWGPPLNPTPGREHLAAFEAVEPLPLPNREPPAHTRLRALVNKAFVSRQVERLRPRIETMAHELIDAFPQHEPFDLLESFATPIPVFTICDMLGVPRDASDRLLDWSHAIVKMYMHGRSRADEDAANAASLAFSDFLRALIAERRGHVGDDLLSVLIAARDHGEKLTDDELVTSVILLLNAGHEATVHQTGNAVRTILSQGGDPRRFFAKPEAAEVTVEECLRFDAPLHLFTRFVYEPVELADGVVLDAGKEVGLLLGAANRDPASFSDPGAFRPGRVDQKNVTFGAGIHFCIGAPLARIEMQMALTALFHRLPGLCLAEDTRYRDIYHFHGLERVMVRTRSNAIL